MDSSPSLVWFRQDLRLEDNPALNAACQRGGAVIPVYIWAPEEEGGWAPGEASRWWLHHSLLSLEKDLKSKGSNLVYALGPSEETLLRLAKRTGAGAVYWNRRYEPASRKRDEKVEKALMAQGLNVETFNASLLFEPWEIETQQGNPYQVFTPFWKACRSRWPFPQNVDRSPKKIRAPGKWPKGVALSSLELEPKLDWKEGLAKGWNPGEKAAKDTLKKFLKQGLADYPDRRNRPDLEGTSRLSPYLRFGEIGPRQICEAISDYREDRSGEGLEKGVKTFLSEIGWREFAYHLLYHFPHTPTEPLREQFKELSWRKNQKRQEAWNKGRTGYPIVDAAMRQLWETGWMHNRCRMIVASFLTKDLMIPWQEGAKWFWDTLVDADLANNTLGWQWTAGCGADASPFIRVFNPITQGEKFDPNGDYIRRWIPELAYTPRKYVHRPWEEIIPGLFFRTSDYPARIVDHSAAREKALAAFEEIRRK